jgi:hypothetical protein
MRDTPLRFSSIGRQQLDQLCLIIYDQRPHRIAVGATQPGRRWIAVR